MRVEQTPEAEVCYFSISDANEICCQRATFTFPRQRRPIDMIIDRFLFAAVILFYKCEVGKNLKNLVRRKKGV